MGNMLDGVDAIRHYSQMLDDLNKLISNEQAVAKRLATYSKSVSNDSGKVLDEFLKVTEIGSTKKLYNENKSGKLLNSPSPSSKSAAPAVALANEESEYVLESYQNNPLRDGMSPGSTSSGKETSGRDSATRIRPFRIYRMSWREWGWAMWTAPSLTDCWRTFREFRYAEDHSNRYGSIPNDDSNEIDNEDISENGN